MSSTTAISTTFASNGHPPTALTFLRTEGGTTARKGAARSDDALSGVAGSDALDRLLARENEVFAWLERSEENARLFASDPVAALQAALPDLDRAVLDDLRAAATQLASRETDVESVQVHDGTALFENAVVTPTPAAAASMLIPSPAQMNGWDMIVATRQGLINSGLRKLYTSETVRATVDVGGFIGPVEIDVRIGPPAVDTLDGGGRLARVALPLLDGFIKRKSDGFTIRCTGATLKVTSNIVVVEATMQPKPGEGKYFDVFIDLRNAQAVYDIELPGTSDPLASAFLVSALKSYLQSLAGKSYKIATINLGKSVPKQVEPLIPQVADFTFIKDATKPDDTTFAALLLNDTKKPRGDFFFNASMIPDGGKAVAMISNEVFISQMVYPALKSSILSMAKPGQESAIVTNKDDQGAWHIRNTGDIDLDKDKDPWIENETLDCRVDGDKLRLQLEVRAKVTFLKIRVKIKGFIGWEVQIKRNGDQQAIELVMTEYREEKSSSMEWWKWLLSALGGITAVIAAAVVNLAVRLKIPGLPKNVFEMPMEAVAWPYYEQLRLDSVALPSPVVIAGTPKLLEA